MKCRRRLELGRARTGPLGHPPPPPRCNKPKQNFWKPFLLQINQGTPLACRGCAAALASWQHAPESGSYAFAGWVLKTGERALVDREGVSVPLSTGEYNLLLALVTRPRQVLTRDQLLDLTQGREAAAFDRAIDNQVSRLRRKIEADAKLPEIIKTVWGGGYTLAAEVTRL